MPDMSRELVAASSRPLILSILSQGESYGDAILQQVAELTGGRLQWTEGMLYPVLHKLEQDGAITAEWKQPEGERKRKYYRIKDNGHAALTKHQDDWMSVHNALTQLWKAKMLCFS